MRLGTYYPIFTFTEFLQACPQVGWPDVDWGVTIRVKGFPGLQLVEMTHLVDAKCCVECIELRTLVFILI